MKNSTEVPQKKLEAELPYDPAIPLLGIYTDKTIIQKDTCTPIFIAALFIISKTWKQSLGCSYIHQQMNKDMVPIYNITQP